MEKKTLITIFVFFLLSNQLYKIFWEILKALLYLYAIIIGLNYLNPSLGGTLKKYLSFVLQFDKNIFQILLSKISSEAIKFFNNKPKIIFEELNKNVKEEQKILQEEEELEQEEELDEELKSKKIQYDLLDI